MVEREDEAPTPRRAVALRYDTEQDPVPRIVASGDDLCADRILELATEHGVPLVEDPDLAALLAACDLGETIPEELFDVVAQVLVFLYELNGDLARDVASNPAAPLSSAPWPSSTRPARGSR